MGCGLYGPGWPGIAARAGTAWPPRMTSRRSAGSGSGWSGTPGMCGLGLLVPGLRALAGLLAPVLL